MQRQPICCASLPFLSKANLCAPKTFGASRPQRNNPQLRKKIVTASGDSQFWNGKSDDVFRILEKGTLRDTCRHLAAVCTSITMNAQNFQTERPTFRKPVQYVQEDHTWQSKALISARCRNQHREVKCTLVTSFIHNPHNKHKRWPNVAGACKKPCMHYMTILNIRGQ